MKFPLKVAGIFLCSLFVSIESSFAFYSGGLASPLGSGGLALSTSLSYGQTDVTNGEKDDVESLKMLFRANFGIFDDLDLFGTVGFADAKFEDFEGTMGEALGVGVHYRLLKFPESATDFMLEIQGDYSKSKDGDSKVVRQGGHVSTYVVREIGAAGRVGYFYPYAGIRVSYSKYDVAVNGGDGKDDNKKSDNPVGPFCGVDYFVNPNVYFSGEVHLIDENSIYLGVGYRF